MSFTGVFGLVLLVIVAIALLGPRKLPLGVEQLWLMITNLRRSQAELPTLSLDQARELWSASDSPLWSLVQILYGSVEHLMELRKRLFVVLGVMLVAAVASAFVAQEVMKLLVKPAGGAQMIVLRPTDMVWTYVEVILSMAVVITVPVLVYQTLMFVRPALEGDQELSVFRTIALLGLPLILVFFVLGMAFAYSFMLPVALRYLQSFGLGIANVSWNIRDYYSFVLTVLLWIGAAFETPLIMALLARLGMVSPQAMARQWRWAIVGCAFVAAMITPTVDPFNMAFVMAPLLLLYFTGVLMAKAVYRTRSSAGTQSEAGSG